MTVALILEMTRRPPPVMFTNRAALVDWAESSGLHVRTVDATKARETNFLRVEGNLNYGGALGRYDLIWVRAKYTGYGSANAAALDEIYTVFVQDQKSGTLHRDFDSQLPSVAMKGLIDADHVVAKASLRENHPEAWVVLFPVPSALNRAMGAKFEKFLPPVSPDTKVQYLSPLTAFKLFAGVMPRNRFEFNQMLEEKVARQLLTTEPHVELFVNSIRDTLETSFPA
nr:hypothetical protein REQ54_01622 [Rhizobium sp. Q54]